MLKVDSSDSKHCDDTPLVFLEKGVKVSKPVTPNSKKKKEKNKPGKKK